jgi:hypothetical protein
VPGKFDWIGIGFVGAWLIGVLPWLQVEHIVREENMMAAQEILELFCELVAVRLPIIETQKLVIPFINSVVTTYSTSMLYYTCYFAVSCLSMDHGQAK